MDRISTELTPITLMVVDGEVGGVADLLTISAYDPDPTVPDLAPFILLVRERRGEGPAQPVAMLVHCEESRFLYIYSPISPDHENTCLTATPLVCGDTCVVIYSPEWTWYLPSSQPALSSHQLLCTENTSANHEPGLRVAGGFES